MPGLDPETLPKPGQYKDSRHSVKPGIPVPRPPEPDSFVASRVQDAAFGFFPRQGRGSHTWASRCISHESIPIAGGGQPEGAQRTGAELARSPHGHAAVKSFILNIYRKSSRLRAYRQKPATRRMTGNRIPTIMRAMGKKTRAPLKDLPIIGWREWIALPGLGISAIKAKIDTGARTSALHAHDLEYFERDGIEHVRFTIHPFQRDTKTTIRTESPLVDQRWVRSSSGHKMKRPVILTPVGLMDRSWEIEVTLTNRDVMGFRMLLGRRAIARRFLVAVHRSFLGNKRPSSATSKKARSS